MEVTENLFLSDAWEYSSKEGMAEEEVVREREWRVKAEECCTVRVLFERVIEEEEDEERRLSIIWGDVVEEVVSNHSLLWRAGRDDEGIL